MNLNSIQFTIALLQLQFIINIFMVPREISSQWDRHNRLGEEWDWISATMAEHNFKPCAVQWENSTTLCLQFQVVWSLSVCLLCALSSLNRSDDVWTCQIRHWAALSYDNSQPFTDIGARVSVLSLERRTIFIADNHFFSSALLWNRMMKK